MKFLTIRQPWASLIAVGAKTIETRPFSTQYRGPLAIHAGKAKPVDIEGRAETWMRPDGLWLAYWDGEASQSTPCPLGAVVAECDLVDVVPITEPTNCPDGDHVCRLRDLVLVTGDKATERNIERQRQFGDFTPGRYAWLLANVRPIDPVPMKGAQGLRDVPADVAAQLREVTE